MTTPTVRTDYKARVIAFLNRYDAETEAREWRAAGAKARIIVRARVSNVVVSF
jgi:hypothetical protein